MFKRSKSLSFARIRTRCSSHVHFRIMDGGVPAMLTLDKLSENVAAYQSGQILLRDFRNWFEDNSSAAYGVGDLHDACIAVDAAFSEYYYDNIGEAALKARLENAIRPFPVVAGTPLELVIGQPSPNKKKLASATFGYRLTVAV
jgi:hypothetical protein